MTDTIEEALECADRADAAARLRGEETTHGSRVLRRLVADLERTRAELDDLRARGVVPDAECRCGSGGHPRRCEKHPHRFEMHVREINEAMELEASRAELAATRESMPAADDLRVCLGYMCITSLPDPDEYRAWQRVTAWMRARLNAYNAAHPAASPAAEVAAAFAAAPDLPEPLVAAHLDCPATTSRDGVPPSRGDIGGPSGEKEGPTNVLSPIEWVKCECADPSCTRRIPINKAEWNAAGAATKEGSND